MLDTMECPVYPELAEAFKDLQSSWRNKTLTDEFYIEICEMSCNHHVCIDDFRWRADPSTPAVYSKYKTLSPKDKDKFLIDNPGFFIKGKVHEYFDARDHVRNFNKRNMDTLRSWLNLKISVESRILVEKYLNTFSGKEKKIDQPNMPKEVQDVIDSFGGTVVGEI